MMTSIGINVNPSEERLLREFWFQVHFYGLSLQRLSPLAWPTDFATVTQNFFEVHKPRRIVLKRQQQEHLKKQVVLL